MNVYGEIRLNFQSRALRGKGQDYCKDLVQTILRDASSIAHRNVTPHQGPGPHPHITEHTDTGELLKHIKMEMVKDGDGWTGVLTCDLEYGLFLEAGYHTRSGRFVRYPWLEPAMSDAVKRWATTATVLGRRYFNTSGGVITIPAANDMNNLWEWF